MVEIQKTGFVIKASAADQVLWVGPLVAGCREFGDLARAEVFPIKADANAAIGEIPLAFDRAGFVFSVEAVASASHSRLKRPIAESSYKSGPGASDVGRSNVR